jgi:hypothetical protein
MRIGDQQHVEALCELQKSVQRLSCNLGAPSRHCCRSNYKTGLVNYHCQLPTYLINRSGQLACEQGQVPEGGRCLHSYLAPRTIHLLHDVVWIAHAHTRQVGLP